MTLSLALSSLARDHGLDLDQQKIDLMVLVAMAVLYSRKHIAMLAWVLTGSLGFYGVKGGLLNPATIHLILKQRDSSKRDHSMAIWSLLMLDAFVSYVMDETQSSALAAT